MGWVPIPINFLFIVFRQLRATAWNFLIFSKLFMDYLSYSIQHGYIRHGPSLDYALLCMILCQIFWKVPN